MKANRIRSDKSKSRKKGLSYKQLPVLLKWKESSLYGIVRKNIKFTLFLTIVGLIYIWNSHYAQRQTNKVSVLEKEIKALKSDYMTLNAELSVSRKLSVIGVPADSLGLEPLKKPPFKLTKDHSE